MPLDCAPDALTLTMWPSAKHPAGVARDFAPAELLVHLRDPKVTTDKTSLPGFGLASYRDHYRDTEHLIDVCAVGLDDDASGRDVEATAAAWSSLAGVVYSTFSSTPEAPRTRTIVFTSRRMTPSEYAVVWTFMRDAAREQGITLDEATKDPTRLWFVPAVRPDASFYYAELGGVPLDVDRVLAIMRERTPEVSAPSTVARDATRDPATSIDPENEPAALRAITQAEREAAAARYLATIPIEKKEGGDGSSQMIRLAGIVTRAFACGVDGGVRVLRNSSVGASWRPRDLRKKCTDAMNGERYTWGSKLVDGAQILLAEQQSSPATATTAADEPIPFDEAGELPPFPLHALPPVLRDFVDAEAHATQTPPDLAGMLVLGACAACIAGKRDLLVTPGWREPLNLYVVVALPPAERKSAVFAAAFDPIYEAQKMKADAAAPTIAMVQAQRDLAETALKKKRAEYAKLTKHDVKQEWALNHGPGGAALAREIQEGAAALARIEVPAAPQLIAADVTMEKLAMLLAEQSGRMCCASAEGALFSIAAGRYAKNGKESFEVLLQGHAGDPIHIHRVGRPGLYVPQPRLTLVYAVQPAVIQSLGCSETMRNLGLLARFLYSFPTSKVGTRAIDAAPVPDAVRERYAALLKSLAMLPTPEEQRLVQPMAPSEIPLIDLSPEARALHRDLMLRLEPRLHPQSGDLAAMGDWAGKLAGAIARIAGVLHVAEYGAGGSVGAHTMQNAITLGESYALPHAARAFGIMVASRSDEDARALLAWIRKTDAKSFTERNVLHRCRAFHGGGEKVRARLASALRELQARGYIRPDGAAWSVR